MASSVADRLHGIPRKQLAMRGETARNFVADTDHRALVGQVIDLTLKHSKLTPKDAAARMGYEDGGASLSRWIAGAEPPSMWRLLRVPALRRGLVLALAELEDGAAVSAVITIPLTRQL